MNVVTLLAALDVAANKHRHQRRKDAEGLPYVNHPIAVTRILAAEDAVDNAGLERAFDEAVANGRAREEHVADFATFVAGSSWRFAKTYVESYPHEYTRLQAGDPDHFQTAIACIERWGNIEPFWRSRRRYLYVDGLKYWHMGDPASEKPDDRPTLINRSWVDVARYRDDAGSLGYEGARLEQLVEQWKVKLDQAKRTRDENA